VWPTGALTPTPATARADLPIIYGDGCHLTAPAVAYPPCHFGDTQSKITIVLFGDSHAAQWFPTLEAIAIEHHWLVVSRTKSGCPAPDVTIYQRNLKRAYDECDTWRASVLAELSGPDKPTRVIAWRRPLRARSGRPDGLARWRRLRPAMFTLPFCATPRGLAPTSPCASRVTCLRRACATSHSTRSIHLRTTSG
jgi:hypothetical protein